MTRPHARDPRGRPDDGGRPDLRAAGKEPRRSGPASATPIADAAEAFLAGRYLDHAGPAGEVPGWLALNRVAHAEAATLRAVAAAPTPATPWRRREQVLARRVLALAVGDQRQVAELQRAVLVPLEHRLSSPHPSAARSAAAAMELALAALSSWTSGPVPV